jgi:hypothetical protein
VQKSESVFIDELLPAERVEELPEVPAAPVEPADDPAKGPGVVPLAPDDGVLLSVVDPVPVAEEDCASA